MLLAAVLALSGCIFTGDPEGDRPIVLHLSVADSLLDYDSVHIALTPADNPDKELEFVHRGHLFSAQIPTHTLEVVKDPFMVKVLAFRKVVGLDSREQLALGTYIFYEGGRKRVERLVVPPLVPFNRLLVLVPSQGTLEPVFKMDVTAYSLRLPRGVTSLTFDTEPEYFKAAVAVGGEPVRSGAPKRVFAIGSRDTTISVTVTDLQQTRVYQVQVIPEKPLSLALDSVWNSQGTLVPAFHPDSVSYKLVLPAVISSVDFKLWPRDPGNTVLTFEGAVIFPGAQRTVRVDTAGGSVTALAVLARDGDTRGYRFTVIRSP